MGISQHGPWCMYTDIEAINRWLDSSNPNTAHEDAMRVLKLVEEAGEAASAYIGKVGQNPRKGITHTRDELLWELADVAITALCAMQHFTQDSKETARVISEKLAAIQKRAGIPDHQF